LIVPFGSDDRVSVNGAGLITRLTGPVIFPCGLLASVAVTVKLAVPAVVGVPEIVQLLLLSPAGSVPVMTQL
jgi:hypothetical protein